MKTQFYDLICVKQGKETVVMTDSLIKINKRLKVLRASQRGIKQVYVVQKSTQEEKYQKKHKHRSH